MDRGEVDKPLGSTIDPSPCRLARLPDADGASADERQGLDVRAFEHFTLKLQPVGFF